MPERFLLQVLRSLVTHGILRSTRGVEGGDSLQKPPEEVSLLEVIEAVEGPLTSASPVGDEIPERSRRRLEEALDEVTRWTRGYLQQVTFAQLIEEETINGV